MILICTGPEPLCLSPAWAPTGGGGGKVEVIRRGCSLKNQYPTFSSPPLILLYLLLPYHLLIAESHFS